MEHSFSLHYHFKESPTGLVVTGADRLPTLIAFTPNQAALAVVHSTTGAIPAAWREAGTLSQVFNPFAFRGILQAVAWAL